MNPLAILDIGGKLIDKIWPDPVEKAKAQARLFELQQAGELKELDSAMQIITSEAKSEHFLVAAWRPITMLTFVLIVANNYILYPYLSLFWESAPVLAIPPDLWDLLKNGIGDYGAGPTGENMMKSWNKAGNN